MHTLYLRLDTQPLLPRLAQPLLVVPGVPLLVRIYGKEQAKEGMKTTDFTCELSVGEISSILTSWDGTMKKERKTNAEDQTNSVLTLEPAYCMRRALHTVLSVNCSDADTAVAVAVAGKRHCWQHTVVAVAVPGPTEHIVVADCLLVRLSLADAVAEQRQQLAVVAARMLDDLEQVERCPQAGPPVPAVAETSQCHYFHFYHPPYRCCRHAALRFLHSVLSKGVRRIFLFVFSKFPVVVCQHSKKTSKPARKISNPAREIDRAPRIHF